MRNFSFILKLITMNKTEINKRINDQPFAYVALWQFIGFALLVCIVWVSETMDLPNLFFGIPHEEVNIFRACLISAAVILCAIIVVGNTYLQQKHIIKGLLLVCSSCQKVKVNEEKWKHMDEYVSEHSLAAFSHGLCPECYEKMNREISFY